MRIFVTGGTGYVGRPIVRQLIAEGHIVTLLTRKERNAESLGKDVSVVVGDLQEPASLHLGLHQAEAVVHLVGIIRERPSRGETMQRVHVDGTTALLRAAIKAGVSRFLHMSALGARADAPGLYHRSKWEAEKQVRQSGLAFTIFRPSVIFGPGGPGPNFVLQLANAVSQLPFVPMLGDGQFLLQPVHTATVSDVFVQSLTKPETIGETFEVGGPTLVTYRDVLRQITAVLDTRKPTIEIPLVAMDMAVKWLSWTNLFPLTQDQLTMLREGNTCVNTTRLYEVFRTKKIPFAIHLDDLGRKK